MGKRAKEHRKKVAARNSRIKHQMKKAEEMVRQIIAQGQLGTDQSQYTMQSHFNPAVQSAVDVAKQEYFQKRTNNK